MNTSGHLIAFALCLFTLACNTTREPRRIHEAPSRFGIVRAADEENAHRIAAVLDDVGPHVALMLCCDKPQPVEVCLVPELQYAQLEGACYREKGHARIEMRDTVTPAIAGAILGHELVHAWIDEEKKRVLPAAIEEGMADCIANVVNPALGPESRLVRVLVACKLSDEYVPLQRGGLVAVFWDDRFPAAAMSESTNLMFLQSFAREIVPAPAEAVELDIDHRDPRGLRGIILPLYCIGFVVVSRIGLDRLDELCASAIAQGRSKISAYALLAAAGLDAESYASWPRSIGSILTDSDVQTIVAGNRQKANESRARAGKSALATKQP